MKHDTDKRTGAKGVLTELQRLPEPAAKDDRGRVRVWIFADKKWCYRMPIDAREIVSRGVGSFEEPDTHSSAHPGKKE